MQDVGVKKVKGEDTWGQGQAYKNRQLTKVMTNDTFVGVGGSILISSVAFSTSSSVLAGSVVSGDGFSSFFLFRALAIKGRNFSSNSSILALS